MSTEKERVFEIAADILKMELPIRYSDGTPIILNAYPRLTSDNKCCGYFFDDLGNTKKRIVNRSGRFLENFEEYFSEYFTKDSFVYPYSIEKEKVYEKSCFIGRTLHLLESVGNRKIYQIREIPFESYVFFHFLLEHEISDQYFLFDQCEHSVNFGCSVSRLEISKSLDTITIVQDSGSIKLILGEKINIKPVLANLSLEKFKSGDCFEMDNCDYLSFHGDLANLFGMGYSFDISNIKIKGFECSCMIKAEKRY